MGPIGVLIGPNITSGNLGAAYNQADGELARLLKHGIKKDGRSVRLMPCEDFGWLPTTDVVAIVSYLRTVAKVDRANGASAIRTLGKVLDRRDQLPLDVARRIDHRQGRQESSRHHRSRRLSTVSSSDASALGATGNISAGGASPGHHPRSQRR